MLTIRREQLRVLGEVMQRRFEERMLAHLRAEFPAVTRGQTDDDLLALVRRGVASAEPYGVRTEVDVQRYLEYMMIYGPDFDTNPRSAWAGDILRTEGIGGAKKMDWIDDYDLFVSRP